MIQMFYSLLQWFAKGGIASFLIGAGLSVATYTGLDFLVQQSLDSAASYLGGLPSDVLGILLLAGVGESMSIIGAALLTRISLVAATKSLGLVKTGTPQ